MALFEGDKARAHQLVDEAFETLDQSLPKTLPEKLALSLSETELDVRTVNLLEAVGIYTVEELLYTPRDVLLSYTSIGQGTVDKIMAMLAQLGFKEQRNG